MQRRAAFLFLGETLLIPHLFPVAEALAALEPDLPIDLWVSAEGVEQFLLRWTAHLDRVRVRRAPGFRKQLGRVRPAPKIPTLVGLAPYLASVPVVVCAEQTSLWLPRVLPGLRARFIKTSHGVGSMSARDDRRRMAAHHTLVPSEQERRTYLDRGMAPDRITATGYVKAAFRQRGSGKPLFADRSPVILYTPHWQAHRSSWPDWGLDVVATLAAQRDYNVIIAPHQRLIERAPNVRAMFDAVAHLPHVHCDLGSFASVDGSYTAAADLYLGDTSSQLLEFLMRPRPALFLDPSARDWRGDPQYAMWQAGEVLTDRRALLPAIARAFASQSRFAPIQQEIASAALGDVSGAGAARAAEIVCRELSIATTAR